MVNASDLLVLSSGRAFTEYKKLKTRRDYLALNFSKCYSSMVGLAIGKFGSLRQLNN